MVYLKFSGLIVGRAPTCIMCIGLERGTHALQKVVSVKMLPNCFLQTKKIVTVL